MQLLYARGELVELLISSNIARYAEFRAVSRVATCMDDKLVQVPCSRADVFANKTVSVIEKRMLMQLLTSCMDQGADSPEFDGNNLINYLKNDFSKYALHNKFYTESHLIFNELCCKFFVNYTFQLFLFI